MRNTIVLFFGRANPPTLGHGVAVKKVVDVATKENADHVIYISKTVDRKKNPLPVDRKIFWLKKMFGNKINFVPADQNIRTFIESVKAQSGKYAHIIVIAGSDRVPEYQKLLDKYNGTDEFSFDSIRVLSAGERDPDAEGTSGLSATKMRSAATNGDVHAFQQGTGLSLVDSTKMMREVRSGMGIKDGISYETLINKMK